MLEPVLRGEASCHVVTTAVHVRALAAEIEARRGAVLRAHELIAEAVQLPAAEEVVRPLLERPAVRLLLDSARGRFGRSEPFVARVLAAVSPLAATATVGGPSRLSPPELAVLRELPSLLSRREIADARAVSVDIIKTQLRSIFRKLDVDRRRDAVAAVSDPREFVDRDGSHRSLRIRGRDTDSMSARRRTCSTA